jgi:cytochrome P450
MDYNQPLEHSQQGASIKTLPHYKGRLPHQAKKLKMALSLDELSKAAENGPMFVIHDTVYINDAEAAQQIADMEMDYLKERAQAARSGTQIGKSPFGRGNTLDKGLVYVMSDGPLTLPTSDEWRELSAILSRFVGIAGVKHEDMVRPLIEISKVTVDKVNEALSSGKPIDILSIMKEASYEIVMKAVIGIDTTDLKTKEYFDALIKALALTIFPAQLGLPKLDNFPFLGGIKMRAQKTLDTFTSKVIEMAAESKGRNLVNALREAEIPEKTIVGTIHQIIAAGHETTAGTMTAIVSELVKNPELWDRLSDELKNNNVDYRNFNSVHDYMKKGNDSLLHRIIYEVLRMYPPTYLIPSSVQSEEGVNIKGIHIPQGMDIQIIVSNIHKDLKYFTEPLVFDPDRTLPDSPRYTPQQFKAWFGFWDGPRMCVGKHMAMIEMAMLTVAIVQNCPRMEIANPGYFDLKTGVTTLRDMTLRQRNTKTQKQLETEI